MRISNTLTRKVCACRDSDCVQKLTREEKRKIGAVFRFLAKLPNSAELKALDASRAQFKVCAKRFPPQPSNP